MAVELVFAEEVEQDMSEAYNWYEQRRSGLGEEFLSCVEACIQRICRSPELHAKVYQEYRRAMVRRFPYVIFYESVDNTLTVYCIFHTSRDPAKWRERLP
ncbi:MAG: type II toxin-antitoxin system RelE/ParE family toxin [Bythopirellula sp.]|nr:type II toxin-antitoxin system RelE/ParE family toxin [Bythopirellula sp.]